MLVPKHEVALHDLRLNAPEFVVLHGTNNVKDNRVAKLQVQKKHYEHYVLVEEPSDPYNFDAYDQKTQQEDATDHSLSDRENEVSQHLRVHEVKLRRSECLIMAHVGLCPIELVAVIMI